MAAARDAGSLEWVARLARQPDAQARERVLERVPHPRRASIIEGLSTEATARARMNLEQAERLAHAATWLAERLDDAYWRWRTRRTLGHVRSLQGRYAEALASYQSALDGFLRLGQESDAAITMSGALQTLIYLGEYDRANAWARASRKIFARQDDWIRLGRLDCNVGNIHLRQGRFDAALRLYRRATAAFRGRGAPGDVAVTLRNTAVCYVGLQKFAPAVRTYAKARAHCLRHGLSGLVGEIDYNVAYVHYMRGEYDRAINLYRAARASSEAMGDRYHQALCDLDLAELYIELNLNEEGAHQAEASLATFDELGMGYETGKALAILASATSRKGHASEALALFADARAHFRRERQGVWLGLTNLNEAEVLFRIGRHGQARRRCVSALTMFHSFELGGRAAACEILLARLGLASGAVGAAEQHCRSAMKRLRQFPSPALTFEGSMVLGQVHEAAGRWTQAYASYRRAHSTVESLRLHLDGDAFRRTFLTDKQALYESLVWMSLARRGTRGGSEAAFAYIERAKSRSLAESIAVSSATEPHPRANRKALARIQALRQTLRWCDRQIALEEIKAGNASASQLASLRRRAATGERDLLHAMHDAPAARDRSLVASREGTVDLRTIQAAIDRDTTLLEYYEARGILYACVIERDRLEILPLGPGDRVRDHFRLLQLQLSKYGLGSAYTRVFGASLLSSSLAHLRTLYDDLLAPVRDRLQTRHLVVVPHDFLHHLPFHALFDGQQFVADAFSVSYAPSASFHYWIRTRPVPAKGRALVIGVPDLSAPYITDEIHAVAATLPDARVFLGRRATEQRLREFAPASQVVHIAAHGRFRQDNPMFSSIRLGTSELRLLDVHGLRLSAELVTLSGCATGLGVVTGGDEQVGFVRAWLLAGAQALLATLWNVNDASTAEFMTTFYRHWRGGDDKAVAVQRAMRELRDKFPHPYHWAGFVLVGVHENPRPPVSP